MDTLLWDRIRASDQGAFMELYQLHYQALYSFGCHIHPAAETVKDSIHEMFCELWVKRQHAPSVGNSRAYLFTYLKRKLVKVAQKEGSTHYLDQGSERDTPGEQQLPYEAILVHLQTDEHTRQKLTLALSKLTKAQLEIIRLKYYEGLTFEQISAVLSVQTRTVYNQAYEALKRLRLHMKAFLPFLWVSGKIIHLFLEKAW